MTNLIRWEPAREMMTLREAMSHLFDDAYTRPLSLRDGWSVPAVDMYQTDDDVVVKVSLPGFKADEVQINVTGEILTLRGEMKQEEETNDKAWHIREQRWGSFERALALPTDVISAIGHHVHRRAGVSVRCSPRRSSRRRAASSRS